MIVNAKTAEVGDRNSQPDICDVYCWPVAGMTAGQRTSAFRGEADMPSWAGACLQLIRSGPSANEEKLTRLVHQSIVNSQPLTLGHVVGAPEEVTNPFNKGREKCG